MRFRGSAGWTAGAASVGFFSLLVMCGCSSPQRTHYMQHLSQSVSPSEAPDNEVAAAFGLDDQQAPGGTVASVRTATQSRR